MRCGAVRVSPLRLFFSVFSLTQHTNTKHNTRCSGPARDLLRLWGGKEENAVILTDSKVYGARGTGERGESVVEEGGNDNDDDDIDDDKMTDGDEKEKKVGSIGLAPTTPSTSAQLLNHWCEAKRNHEDMEDIVKVTISVPTKSQLAGKDLEAFLQREEGKKQLELRKIAEKKVLAEMQSAREMYGLASADDDNEEKKSAGGGGVGGAGGGAGGGTATTAAAAATKTTKSTRFDKDLFIKFSKPNHMTFTIVDLPPLGLDTGRSQAYDDYGSSVSHENFYDLTGGLEKPGATRKAENVNAGKIGYRGETGDGEGEGKKSRVADTLNEADAERINEEESLWEGTGVIRGFKGKPPQKVQPEIQPLDVLAEVHYVPFEGAAEEVTSRQTVGLLQPRSAIILGAGKPPSVKSNKNKIASSSSSSSEVNGEQNEIFQEECTKLVSSLRVDSQSVFVLNDGEKANVNIGASAFAARLLSNPLELEGDENKMDDEVEVEEELDENGLGESLEIKSMKRALENVEAEVGGYSVSFLNFVATGKKVDNALVLEVRVCEERSEECARSEATS